LVGVPVLELLEEDALVQGVLVDDKQALGHLTAK
jgi:hypothetical protein